MDYAKSNDRMADMAIKTYSLREQGSIRLTAHFQVKEFACNDGSDTILIDEKLAKLLEQIRVWAGASVRITSAYRTISHNRAIGGAAGSYHTKGQAADIVVTGKAPADVARFAQAIGVRGVGLYTMSRFTHVDTRTSRYFWKNAGSGDRKVSGHGGICPYSKPRSTIKKGSKGTGVCWLQWWLKLWSYDISADGIFGVKTDAAVKDFQRRLGLTVDGLVGIKTKNALKGIL